MPAIRNSCVARGYITASGAATLFTVPDATVFLLKDIRLYNATGTALSVALDLNAPSLVEVQLSNDNINGYSPLAYSLWIALNAGDQLLASIPSASTIAYWISGALLPYVPGY